MAKILKPTRFEENLISEIQKIADSDHSGNYTAALESLAKQALAMRCISEDTRWQIYSASKNACGSDFFEDRLIRKLVDGLHI